MSDETGKPRLVLVAEQLQRHGVEFIVIGGQAAVLYGSPLPTYDIDLCYRRSQENLQHLAVALAEIHPTLRAAPPDLSFQLDAQSLALGANFTFNTDLGPLDLLGWVEPLGSYEELMGRTEELSLGSCRVHVISLDDLITIKRHIGRPKDQATLLQLQALKHLRDQS